MRTIEVTGFGGPEVLELREAPDPTPRDGEVLIDVEVVEIIFLDTQLRSGWGKDWFPMRPPWVPGTGVAGTTADGRRVVARTGDEGAYAERVTVAERDVYDIPDGLDPAVATAALHDGVLALHMLELAGTPTRALVTAAAGALGHWFVPLLAARGAEVVGAAGGAAKTDVVRQLGATAVDYRADDWTSRTGDSVDAVFDGAGGAIGRAALGRLAPGGIFLGYGAASGGFAGPGGRDDVTVVGLADGPEPDRDRHTRTALQLLADGAVRPTIGQRVPFAEARRAHEAIAARAVVGKSVLVV